MPLKNPIIPESGDIAFDAKQELSDFESMLLIRRFEEKLGLLVAIGVLEAHGNTSVGKEALRVGTASAARPADLIVSSTGCIGPLLAKGVDPKIVFEGLADAGRRTSAGEVVAFDETAATHFDCIDCASASVGFAHAVSAARKNRAKSDPRVCLVTIESTDASAVGMTEALREAVEGRLAIVVIVENTESQTAPRDAGSGLALIQAIVKKNAIAFASIDGIEVRNVRAAILDALDRARRGGGPSLVEVRTWAWVGHGATDPRATPGVIPRPREETDPVERARARILSSQISTESKLAALDKKIRERVRAAANALTNACEPETAKGLSRAG